MNLKSFFHTALLTTCATVLFSVPSYLVAEDAEAARPLKLRLGHSMPPGNSVTLGYEKFKELLEEKSGGKIQVQIFPNNMIGSDRVTTEAAQAGTLDLTSSSTANLASFHSDYNALDLPYITKPEFEANFFEAIDNGALGDYYLKVAESIGLVPLMYSKHGYRHFATSKQPIHKVEDFQGVKMRTTDSPVEVAVAKALGMTPTPIAFGELYTALQQGTVEGQGNPFATILDTKHYEVLRYAVTSAHNYSMHTLFMSKKKWDTLTGEQKALIKEAAREALAWERSITDELENKARKTLEDAGIEIVDFNESEMQKLVDATQGVRDHYLKQIPTELIELIYATQK